jgi:sugar phosphate isomerase/epimerase
MDNRLKYSIAIGPNLPKTYPAIFKGDLLNNICEVARCGCEYAELHIRTPEIIDVQALRRCCSDNGVKISSISTGMGFTVDGLSLIDDDPIIRKKAYDRLKRMIDLAGEIGSSIIIGLMRGLIPDFSKYSIYEKRLTEEIALLIERAEKANVNLDIEAISITQCNYIRSSWQALEYVKKMGSKRLKILLDTFHMNIEERDFFGCIINCSEWLRYVHYSDSNRQRPGSGNFDFIGMTRSLRRICFDGFVGLEYIPSDNASNELRKTINYLRAIESFLDEES